MIKFNETCATEESYPIFVLFKVINYSLMYHHNLLAFKFYESL